MPSNDAQHSDSEGFAIILDSSISKPPAPLFDWKGKPRPNPRHPEVIRRAVLEILSDVVEWLESRGERKVDEANLVEELAAAAHYDGYRFAKKLEDFHFWEPDSQLIDVLSNFDDSSANAECVREWIEQNNISPKFQSGTKVRLSPEWVRRHCSIDVYPTEHVIGEIIQKSYDRLGWYSVYIEGVGHVREGVGTTATIVEWGDLETEPPIG